MRQIKNDSTYYFSKPICLFFNVYGKVMHLNTLHLSHIFNIYLHSQNKEKSEEQWIISNLMVPSFGSPDVLGLKLPVVLIVSCAGQDFWELYSPITSEDPRLRSTQF